MVHATGTRMLRTAVLLCGDHQRGEDLAQSAYSVAFTKWRLVSRADDPAAYVRTIMMRLYLREQRRHRVREVPLVDDMHSEVIDPSLRLSLLSALTTLPDLDRAVVVLRFWEDLSIAQTSAQLDITESACRTRSSRALARLRSRFPELAQTAEDDIS
nr:sigma-70 family RNA polymerase sigma factor [Nocardioides flavescens]